MKKISKKFLILLSLLLGLGFFLYQVQDKVLAEQSGSSPESGVSSRIKTIYDSLVSLSHGSDAAGGWGNWGVMWNRIRSAAEWVPSGDATEGDVVSGKLFYKDSRTQKTGTLSLSGDASTSDVALGKTFYANTFSRLTGTASLAPDWSTFSQQILEDAAAADSTTEESSWINTAGTATTGVWKDNRTGLYWSAAIGSYTWSTAWTTCDNLSLNAIGDSSPETNWYLPTQKELMMAYIDGIYNQTNTTFTSSSGNWANTTSTINNSYADTVELSEGEVNIYTSKGSTVSTRCVRRD